MLNWSRTVELIGATTLRVTDSCQVAAGIRPVFQVNVPSAPVLQANGSIVAGVKREPNYLQTETLLMRSKTGSLRRMIYRNPLK